MKLTNKRNLPDALVKAIESHVHDRGEAFASATELLKSPRQFWLQRRHDNEVTEDVVDNIWALFGTSIHAILQASADDNVLVEEKLFGQSGDHVISGSADYFDGETIQDWKVTSAWTLVYKDRFEEWAQQLNIYAWLYEQHNFPVANLEVVAILRDWQKSKYLSDPVSYPNCQVMKIKLPLWDNEHTKSFISDRVNTLVSFQDTLDDELPPCSESYVWATQTKYAVMKDGRKSAVKLFTDQTEAEKMAEKCGANHRVDVRTGEWKRCPEYCNVAPFCSQFKAYKEAANG